MTIEEENKKLWELLDQLSNELSWSNNSSYGMNTEDLLDWLNERLNNITHPERKLFDLIDDVNDTYKHALCDWDGKCMIIFDDLAPMIQEQLIELGLPQIDYQKPTTNYEENTKIYVEALNELKKDFANKIT